MADKQTELHSPDGKRTWTPADAVEAVNLRSKGWAPKPAVKTPAKTDK